MSKKKRLKKIVKSRLHRVKPGNGLQEFANDAAKIAALESMNLLADGDGHQAGDAKLLDVLGISNPGAINETLDIDNDDAVAPNDAFPRDAREQTDTDGDKIGDNKEIHDAALLVLAERTAGGVLFTAIQTAAGNGAGEVDALLTTLENTAEPANHAADGGAYQTAYNAAKAALDDLNADILAFEQHAATTNTLYNSVKDLTPKGDVRYRTDANDPATLKLVSDSYDDVLKHQAEFTNNSPQIVAPNLAGLALMDIATEKAKVTTAVTGFDARLAAETDPATIPDA